jgi:peptidyl-prolyl cis-trans isomerase SurA
MNNNKRLFINLLIWVSTLNLFAQSKGGDQIILKIDDKPITKSEFEAVFFKNNPNKEVKDQKSVEEYMEMFINFKLKVKNAEELGMDTARNFLNELAGYRKQLASPYLTDKTVNEQLILEAYERLKTEVHASHILVKVSEDALPKDTLEAYNKIINFRNRALKGEDFGKIAKETADKGDPSARDNKGDLGFFTAFAMVYPFETAAYNTKVGEISMPVRTAFGYHIIKVWEKRPASGEILVSHLALRMKKDASKEDSLNAKKKIEEIYGKIKSGSNFEDLCSQFSDDKSTASKGGQLPWISRGKLPFIEFENVAFNLKANGDISEPFLTAYGWHIVKRIDKRDLATFEKMRNELKQKVEKGQRGQVGKASMIAKIKNENVFTEFTTKNKKNVSFVALEEVISKLDTTFWEGKWNSESAKGMTKPLFKIGSATYTQLDFAKFLEQRQTKRAKSDFNVVVRTQYNTFVNEKCISLEESMLDKKYPEFKALMQEYRDGILLFDLLDKKVWSKAMKDSVGLKNYYEQNKNNYLWEERADVSLYKCADDKIAKQVKSMISKKKTDKEITENINKNSQLNLNIENIMYLKKERKLIDENWKEGLFGPLKDESDGKLYVVKVNKLLPKQPKQINEAKGAITSDYQNYLEKEWVKELRSSHKLEINKEVMATVGK